MQAMSVLISYKETCAVFWRQILLRNSWAANWHDSVFTNIINPSLGLG